MSVTIRRATAGDIPGIRAVARAAWEAAHEPIVGEETVEEFLAEYYTREAFLEYRDREDSILDVAVDDQDYVTGYVLVIRDEATPSTYHLAQIYVRPTRWGEGIGQRLLAHLEDKVRTRGGDRIELGVMAGNDRAVDFYEAAGYNQIEEGYDERIEARNYTYAKSV